MKGIAIFLALGGCVVGLVAAWYWFKSARVSADPLRGLPPGALLPPEGQDMAWVGALLRANQEIGALNATAARLTAIAVVLSTLSAIAGVL